MSNALRAAVAGLTASLWVLSPATGDDADNIINQIVRKSRTSAERAEKLVAAAKLLADAPAVQVRVCEKAYQFGIMASSGYASALAALDLLGVIAPSRADALRTKRLEVHRLMYLRGPRKDRAANGRAYVKLLTAEAEVQDKPGKYREAAKHLWQAYGVARALILPERKALHEAARAAEARAQTQARLATLKASIAKDPDDVSVRRRLVRVYLVDLDMPDQAAGHLSSALDATLRKNVSLAAKEASELADGDFFTLGQWYRSLAAQTGSRQARGRLLKRASDYLGMYLEVHTTEDMQRRQAAEGFMAVAAELKKLGLSSGARAVPSKGLMLHYTFDATRDGRIVDASGRNHHGRAAGARPAPDARGKGNAACLFDGRDDSVGAGADKGLKMADAVTVCAWIRPASFGGFRNVLSDHGRGGNNGKILRLQNQRIEFMLGPEGSADVGWELPAAGKWYHVAATFDGTAMHLYIDGARKASRPLKRKVTINANPVLIGMSGFREYFHGMMDDVMLYNRALSKQEVTQTYSAQRGR